ncbi:MAG: recombinase family protein [Planctomycetes bacterium]|nr:recombinase family protein [Planctomycetota bacterium]
MPITNVPLIPRDPNGKLVVVVIGRISTPDQNKENIDASYRVVKSYLADIYDGEMDIRFLGEQASGMLTDRSTIREAEDLVNRGIVDLVISEDLSRIYRNPRHQYNFVQDAVDAGTRLICIGDNLDTADENWEVSMGTAALRHGLLIPDTRRRIRRTATDSFHKGGQVTKVKYGYRKLTKEEAASGEFGPEGLRMAKVGECTPVIHEMRRRLMKDRMVAPVVDWLNDEGISPGPYVKKGRWSRSGLKELMRDPILSGTRMFRDTLYSPIFKTGKHRRSKNPQPEFEQCPELAHMTLEEQKSMLDAMDWTLNKGEPVDAPRHPRAGIPRSRSIWPGQSATCAICTGRMYVMGDHMRCEKSLKINGKACWNHVQAPVELTRTLTVDWLLSQFERNPACREAFVDAAWETIQLARQRSRQSQGTRRTEINSLEKQTKRLVDAISEGGELKTLVEALATAENRIKELQSEGDDEAEIAAEFQGLNSRDEVNSKIDEALRTLASSSFEFAETLRRYFPYFVIQPVQALDTGQVRARAKLRFVSDILPEHTTGEKGEPESTQEIELVWDLFDPPVHIQAIPVYLELKAKARKKGRKISLKKMQEISGINFMAFKRAGAYIRLMEQAGTDDPYIELVERPHNASRWR